MSDFQDDSWGYIRDFFRLKDKYGLYKGDKFFEWYGELLEKKTGNKDVTFQEVLDKYGIELVITGSCLNKLETHYYHSGSNPDMPVRMAVRISMSIPWAYVPVKWKDDLLVDGGLGANYPIWIFDKEVLEDSKKEVIQYDPSLPVNEKTLGIKLVGPEDTRDRQIYHENKPIKGKIDFTMALVNFMMAQIERGHVKEGYWDQTITVDCGDVSTMDFSMSTEKKEWLVKEGYETTKRFLESYSSK
jgi:NTE family protein